jgi:hypothetical protein
MTYLTIHHLPGDAATLHALKRERFDPVLEPLARKHGAILSLTARTGDGLLIVNLWETPEGAARLREEPDALSAQQQAQLPPPSGFDSYDNIQFDDFRSH